MRADQHKDNSSKKKKLLIYFLILIVVVAIAFIGIKSFDFSSPSNKSAKVTTKTDKKIAESSVKKKELDELAKAMDGVLSLYEGSDLKEFRSDITTEDVDKARKLVKPLDNKVKVKKELTERLDDAQKFIKEKKSNEKK